MNPIIPKLQERADRAIAGALRKDAHAIPCHAGCFWCCKESVYAGSSEVAYALELLTPEQRTEVAGRVLAWLDKFLPSSVRKPPEPHATDYRALNLWCPLLDRQTGRCMVYARRPLACRSHIALETHEGCQHDSKRMAQKFALFPGLHEALCAQFMEAMQDGDIETHDHLTVLLAQALLGEEHITGARLTIERQGDTLIVKRYEEEEQAKGSTA